MKKTVFAAALIMGVSSTTAFAQDDTGNKKAKPKKSVVSVDDTQFYGSASLTFGQFTVASGGSTSSGDTTMNAHGRVGVKFAKYFGIEGEVGTGLSDWELDSNSSIGIDTQLAAYAVARYPFGGNGADNGDFFMRVGYHSTDLEATLGNLSDTIKDEGFAFGLGGSYFFTDNFGVRAELTSYHLDDDLVNDIGSFTYITVGAGGVVRF